MDIDYYVNEELGKKELLTKVLEMFSSQVNYDDFVWAIRAIELQENCSHLPEWEDVLVIVQTRARELLQTGLTGRELMMVVRGTKLGDLPYEDVDRWRMLNEDTVDATGAIIVGGRTLESFGETILEKGG
jgi:hypothetical protein